jgi:fermentation-respiration switch protein FrsA (DUF1100 family)
LLVQWLLRSSVALVGLFLLACALRYSSRHFLFPVSEVPQGQQPEGFSELVVQAADGVAARALVLPTDASATTLIYFHNNRETAATRSELARVLAGHGVSTVLVEYRGYGRSQGVEPSETGLYLDAEAILNELVRRGVGKAEMVLWGTSLGTGVAAEMARRGWGARLILEAPYTSIPDLVQDSVPLAPATWLVRDHFDTLSKSTEIRLPTLVIHGDQDEIVPFWMGQRLARQLPDATLLCVPGAHHGDLFSYAGTSLVERIASFSRG